MQPAALWVTARALDVPARDVVASLLADVLGRQRSGGARAAVGVAAD